MINESINSNSFLKANFENEPVKTTKKNDVKPTEKTPVEKNESNDSELSNESSYQGKVTKDLSVSDVNPSSIKFKDKVKTEDNEDSKPTIRKIELTAPIEKINLPKPSINIQQVISLKPSFDISAQSLSSRISGVNKAELGLGSFIDSNKRLSNINFETFSESIIISSSRSFITEIESAKDIEPKTKGEIIESIRNIININSDESLSIDSINKLKNIILNIQSKGISPKDKKSLINTLDKSIDIKSNKDKVVEKYNTEAQNISNAATQLQEEINKLRPDQRSAFTDTINELTMKYNEALQSGDVKKIAMYSALMEKVLAKIREGKTEEQEKATGKTLGQDIADLITEYDNLVADFFKEGLDSKQKEEILKRLEIYLGKERFELIINSSTSNPEQNRTSSGGVAVKPSSDDVFNSMRNSLGNKTPDGKIAKPSSLISNEMKEGLSKISSKDITKLFKNNPNLKKAFDNFEEATKRFLKIQAELSNLLNKLNNIFIKPIKKADFIQDNLREVIKELIEKIEIMEQNLDLEIHTNRDDTTIVTLLQKFRDIINKLDLQTRENISKTNDSLMISLKNDLHIRDMKLRWESLDKIRFQLNKLLQDLKR